MKITPRPIAAASFRRVTLPASLFVLASLLVGCQPTDGTTGFGKTPDATLPKTISTRELANTLGMRVTQTRPTLARIEGRGSRILLLGGPNAAAIVNGRRITLPGPVESNGQTLLMPASWATSLKEELRTIPVAVTAAAIETPPPAKANRTPRGVVVLDAGHGGRDPGAIGPRQQYEKNIVLPVVLHTARLLRAQGVTVVLTRASDTALTLDSRVAIARRANAVLFVSVHADASHRTSVQGFTVFYPRRTKWGSPSYRVGKAITDELDDVVVVSRGIRKHDKNLRVLERTTCPAVLVELGFISHRGECAQLTSPSHQLELADALADAIHAHVTQ